MDLSQILDTIIETGEAENIAVCVGYGDQILTEVYRAKNGKIDEFTKFDMASVTKILATTSLALIALDRGVIHLNDSISKYLDCPDGKKGITIKNLLTHTMGIGHKSLNIPGNTYDDIEKYILSIPSDIPIGSDVLYSCPGFILLGKILEKAFGKSLDVLFYEMVALPLGMADTSFLPTEGKFVNSNLEAGKIGAVNDCNCSFLGGVAGNAGIFSNMHDMKIYAEAIVGGLDKIISLKTFEMAVNNYTAGMSESRGLGFLIVDERCTQTGKLFATGAIGHCGHTGQSVFVDPNIGLYTVILSDMTLSTVKKYGSERYDDVMNNRRRIHDAILRSILKN